MILLDTHTWIWWASDPKKLSKKANQAIEKNILKNQVYISSISVWELSILVKRGRIKLSIDVERWINKNEKLPFLHFVPLDNQILHQSVYLKGKLHPDPADRMIISTALALNCPLVTKDSKIRKYRYVDTIW